MSSVEAIIDRQFLLWAQQQRDHTKESASNKQPLPIVTVSRQTGSRGSYFASRLALSLGYQRLHSDVIDAISSSNRYRRRIIEFLPPQDLEQLSSIVNSLITEQTVDNTDYSRQLCQVIISMSRLGKVVLVGRGGNFILGPTRGFHIRFVCPRDKRIQNLMLYKNESSDNAKNMIDRSDRLRELFIQKTFSADINDPRYYDLVINAEYIDIEELVPTAIEAIKGKMNKLAHLDNDHIDG